MISRKYDQIGKIYHSDAVFLFKGINIAFRANVYRDGHMSIVKKGRFL
jgi:hypothetical protein